MLRLRGFGGFSGLSCWVLFLVWMFERLGYWVWRGRRGEFGGGLGGQRLDFAFAFHVERDVGASGFRFALGVGPRGLRV